MAGRSRSAPADSDLDITELTDDTSPDVAQWLIDQPDSAIFSDPAWHGIIRSAYGHVTRTWIARRDNRIEGLFSAVWVRVPVLGTKCIALPYQMHSGAPLGPTPEVKTALVRACVEAARADGVKYIEVRHWASMPYLEELGFRSVDSGLVTTVIPLTDLELTQAAHGHRQRVRKAARTGVEIVEANGIDEWRQFRRMYLETGRAMGAPQAGWSFFTGMRTEILDRCRLYLARHESRTVGGFLVVGDRRGVFARCSAHSSREAMSLNVGQALWWRAISDAADIGCEEFNCGITWVGDTGLIKWKEGWGGESRPVHSWVLPVAGDAPSAGGYFEGYGTAKAIWKRLPLPVVDVVGHAVTRWIG